MYGYELDKLLKQYGLQLPTAPSVQQNTQNANISGWSYDDTTNGWTNSLTGAWSASNPTETNGTDYQNEYNRRLLQTQMYSQPQFS